MSISQLAQQIALFILCLTVGAGCAAPTPASQSATATPIAQAATSTPPAPTTALTPTELKYVLLAKYPNFFFCDPDFYPVAHGDEQDSALQRFPEIQSNAEVYQTILRHLSLQPSNLKDSDKLLVYRDFKRLNALPLQSAGDGYAFQLRAADSAKNGTAVEGTISRQGVVSVTKTQPTVVTCPICLAAGTLIDTPGGKVAVQDLSEGMSVWTLDANGVRLAAPIVRTERVAVPAWHEMRRIRLDDGRELLASPGHPTADGRALAALQVGAVLDGARVSSVAREQYASGATYDILPAGSTGLYWANGILLGSTLK